MNNNTQFWQRTIKYALYVLLIDMKDLKYPYYMTQNLYFLGLFLRNYWGGTQRFIHKNNYCGITYIVKKKKKHQTNEKPGNTPQTPD